MNGSHASDQAARRTTLLFLMLAIPVVATALLATGIEMARALRPGASLFAAPPRDDLAAAIAVDDVLGAFAFIRAGQNPDGLIPVRDDRWTGGTTTLVSPLIWAVANGAENSALMLLTAGAQFSNQQDRRAACLAEALGQTKIAEKLRAYAPHQLSSPCPPFPIGRAPLARFVADSE